MPQLASSAILALNPFKMAAGLWSRRELTRQFIVREIQGRYKGSYLGLVWAIINPLLMLAVFTFVFRFLFRSRWEGSHQGVMDYALNLYSGMIAFNIFSESVIKSPTLITSNPNYVKKVVFPLEVLPLSLIGSAVFHGLLSLAILLLVSAAAQNFPHWTLILLPLVCLPLILLTAGISWLLAALGVFLRDIGHVVAVLVQLLFYLTPIVYPMSMLKNVPWAYHVMQFNLMAVVVENFRLVVNDGSPPAWGQLTIATIVCLFIAIAGHAAFISIKRAFADVI
jgi:lipopolysaccharide transport system permease protein